MDLHFAPWLPRAAPSGWSWPEPEVRLWGLLGSTSTKKVEVLRYLDPKIHLEFIAVIYPDPETRGQEGGETTCSL
jgi:hypothetical protein